MKNHSFKLLAFSFILAVCFSFSYSNLSRAEACLPTCSSTDARLLAFAGVDQVSLIQPILNFGIGSSADSTQLNFGIFDANKGGLWDTGVLGMGLEINLYADPLGDGSGAIPIGQWFSDGSGGLNMGRPMPDNSWFDITIPNTPEAMAKNGNYLYRLEVINRDATQTGVNAFKIRAGESLVIFPEQPFAFVPSLQGETLFDFIDVVNIVYPNFNFGAPGCMPLDYCDYTDPACCLFGTTYDGLFDIFVLFKEESTFLDFWDGDSDYGRIIPADGPPYEDTDDPNTPGAPFLPPWANPATANFQASVGASPPDDNTLFGLFLRPPNVTYNLISPDGNSYHNDNPSGTEEWELFQLNTEPGCAPFICDIEVNSVPGGIWRANFVGLEMDNAVFLRLEGIVLGVDDNNEPVPPLSPDLPPPSTVPTFSEWGIVAVFFLLGTIGFYHLRRRKNLQKI